MHRLGGESIRHFGREGFAKWKATDLNALYGVCLEVDTGALATLVKTLSGI